MAQQSKIFMHDGCSVPPTECSDPVKRYNGQHVRLVRYFEREDGCEMYHVQARNGDYFDAFTDELS